MKRTAMVLVAVLGLLLASGTTQVGRVYAQDCVAGANLAGNALPNVLNGGPQDNIIHGGGGNDTIRGFECNDILYGGDGDDMINGGPGYDKCFGGPGVDVFINCEVVVQ